MCRTLNDAIPELCLALPDAEQFLSHGSPNFRLRGGKAFAIYTLNHHGDGRVALWLNAPPGAQENFVQQDPDTYFVPAYVGPRGWLGVRLDRGLAWVAVVERVVEAYRQVAPRSESVCASQLAVKAADRELTAAEIDPLMSEHAQQVISRLRALCLALPETTEDEQFGTPVWRAGKRVFAGAHAYGGPLLLTFWVGRERQSLMTADPRYRIPAYMGHNGWIALDASASVDWDEISALTRDSYRNFALRRMLHALESGAG